MKIKVSKYHLGLEINRDNLDDDAERILNTSINSENEYKNLQGKGMKVIIPSNNFDIWTRPKMLFGLKLTGHSDIKEDSSYLGDEAYRRIETHNSQRYGKALDKFKNWVFSGFWI